MNQRLEVRERLCVVVRVEAQLIPLVGECLGCREPWLVAPRRAAFRIAAENRGDVARGEVLVVLDDSIHIVTHVAMQHLGGYGVVIVVTEQFADVVHERRDNELGVGSSRSARVAVCNA